jgi:hypothetical protein
MPAGPRVTAATFGAWLVKARPDPHLKGESSLADVTTIRTRCLRPSYRTDLVEAGQLVLLWFSGTSATQPAGIHAHGRVTGSAVDDPAESGQPAPGPRGQSTVLMPVDLRPLSPPVLRTDLVAHPVLCRIEVLRMPAGSNPSFLTSDEVAALRRDYPQVAAGV